MKNPLYEKIEDACSRCGQRNVWICSDRECPKSGDQKAMRDRWTELGRNTEGEESGS